MLPYDLQGLVDPGGRAEERVLYHRALLPCRLVGVHGLTMWLPLPSYAQGTRGQDTISCPELYRFQSFMF